MREVERREALTRYWLDKARSAVASAKREVSGGDLSFAVNRLYDACFYAITAVLVSKGRYFRKLPFIGTLCVRGYSQRNWGACTTSSMRIEKKETMSP